MKKIKVTFDGEKPNSITVVLSDSSKVVLSGMFEKEIDDNLFVVVTEVLEKYNSSIDDCLVTYTTKSQEQIKQEKINFLKEQLASQESPYGDWKNLEQMDTGRYTEEEMAEYRAVRETIREQIRALEN